LAWDPDHRVRNSVVADLRLVESFLAQDLAASSPASHSNARGDQPPPEQPPPPPSGSPSGGANVIRRYTDCQFTADTRPCGSGRIPAEWAYASPGGRRTRRRRRGGSKASLRDRRAVLTSSLRP
jgi:hypothetical protein